MYVKSYASFLDFCLLKVAILLSFVIYRGSLSRIYLSAASQPEKFQDRLAAQFSKLEPVLPGVSRAVDREELRWR